MSWQQGAKKLATEAVQGASDLAHKYIDPLLEGDWHLPDLFEDVPITTMQHAPHPTVAPRLTVPARAAPPREKIDVYHGTGARLQPEVRVRDRRDGAVFNGPRPADLKNLPPSLEVVKDLPLGRFDMDKIGTGTGAQMFGHGLYFSDASNIARAYRHGIGNPTIGDEDAYKVFNQLQKQADSAPIAEGRPLYDRLALLEDLLAKGDTLAIHENNVNDAYSPAAMDWFQRNVEPTFDAPGGLYHAQLDASPEQFLSWEDPLSSQPLAMQNLAPLLQKYDLNSKLNFDAEGKYPDTGADLYHMLRMRAEHKRPHLVAQDLVGANIPGIRYIDRDYSKQLTGLPAQNYVMMNPDLIDILKRYRDGGDVHEG
jgi:hypothetical protein